MTRRRQLEWGETPWDYLTPPPLRHQVRRYYSALVSCQSVLTIIREGQKDDPFWGAEGAGGRALARANEIINDIHGRYDSESICRSFFRYANSLLFESETDKWKICEQGTLMSPGATTCLCCGGVMRPITWNDLRKRPHRGKRR